MPYSLSDKLAVGIASSALFDLSKSDKIFREEGTEPYRAYQRAHENDTLQPGVAFPFIKRLLGLNDGAESPQVEVLLMSKNDTDTGLRVIKSIAAHKLNIIRTAFLRGSEPYRYIRSYQLSLFLSANQSDIKEAIMNGLPAGQVLPSKFADDPNDDQLRIAFDFDGVIVGDESERVFKTGGLEKFRELERAKASQVHTPGLLFELLQKVAEIQKRELAKSQATKGYAPRVRTAIITSRDAHAMERMVTTLRHWDITVDETHMLGGLDKKPVIEVFKPHIFFDDQLTHLDKLGDAAPAVHIPFGAANEAAEQVSGN